MNRRGEFGEGSISSLSAETGRGSGRFSLKRVLIGAAIGATAGFLVSAGLGAFFTEGFSDISVSEIRPMVQVIISYTLFGATMGTLMSHYRMYRL